jgi:hypothetical protein
MKVEPTEIKIWPRVSLALPGSHLFLTNLHSEISKRSGIQILSVSARERVRMCTHLIEKLNKSSETRRGPRDRDSEKENLAQNESLTGALFAAVVGRAEIRCITLLRVHFSLYTRTQAVGRSARK